VDIRNTILIPDSMSLKEIFIGNWGDLRRMAMGAFFMGILVWKPMSHRLTMSTLIVNRYQPPGTRRMSSTESWESGVTQEAEFSTAWWQAMSGM
jgi:hypothetical protein